MLGAAEKNMPFLQAAALGFELRIKLAADYFKHRLSGWPIQTLWSLEGYAVSRIFESFDPAVAETLEKVSEENFGCSLSQSSFQKLILQGFLPHRWQFRGTVMLDCQLMPCLSLQPHAALRSGCLKPKLGISLALNLKLGGIKNQLLFFKNPNPGHPQIDRWAMRNPDVVYNRLLPLIQRESFCADLKQAIESSCYGSERRAELLAKTPWMAWYEFIYEPRDPITTDTNVPGLQAPLEEGCAARESFHSLHPEAVRALVVGLRPILQALPTDAKTQVMLACLDQLEHGKNVAEAVFHTLDKKLALFTHPDKSASYPAATSREISTVLDAYLVQVGLNKEVVEARSCFPRKLGSVLDHKQAKRGDNGCIRPIPKTFQTGSVTLMPLFRPGAPARWGTGWPLEPVLDDALRSELKNALDREVSHLARHRQRPMRAVIEKRIALLTQLYWRAEKFEAAKRILGNSQDPAELEYQYALYTAYGELEAFLTAQRKLNDDLLVEHAGCPSCAEAKRCFQRCFEPLSIDLFSLNTDELTNDEVSACLPGPSDKLMPGDLDATIAWFETMEKPVAELIQAKRCQEYASLSQLVCIF